MQVEAELTELDPEERLDYLQSLGVSEGGLGSLVRATYNLLGLRTYFTSGEKVGDPPAVNLNRISPSSTDLNNKWI
jgi:ribosome-binding ATPase YchF (GTP1/OBG family)